MRTPTDSAAAYEAHAAGFLRARDRSTIGAGIVERWSRALRPGADVIELACGGGYPVTRTLAAAGLKVWAIDSSPSLLAEFRNRFPAIPVECERVQESDFFGRRYDAAIAVGLLFLLPEAEQCALISRVADVLVSGGRFLFTAPKQIGDWKDVNTGHACRSLGDARYRACLSAAGFRVVDTFDDEGANNYYDAERIG